MTLVYLFITFILFTIYISCFSNWLDADDPESNWLPESSSKNYIWDFYKNSFNFSGKTSRRDFWITELWLLLIYFLLVGFGFAIYSDCLFGACDDFRPYILIPFYGFSMISGIPNIAIQVRRLRDAAKNPWWLLISLVPFIGTITLLVFYASPSKEKKLPATFEEKLKEVEDFLARGIISQEEYQSMRQKIISKHYD